MICDELIIDDHVTLIIWSQYLCLILSGFGVGVKSHRVKLLILTFTLVPYMVHKSRFERYYYYGACPVILDRQRISDTCTRVPIRWTGATGAWYVGISTMLGHVSEILAAGTKEGKNLGTLTTASDNKWRYPCTPFMDLKGEQVSVRHQKDDGRWFHISVCGHTWRPRPPWGFSATCSFSSACHPCCHIAHGKI